MKKLFPHQFHDVQKICIHYGISIYSVIIFDLHMGRVNNKFFKERIILIYLYNYLYIYILYIYLSIA